MAITVVKGQKVDVTKLQAGLTKIVVGLGWNGKSGIELDASAFQLAGNGKVKKEEDFIFYGNPLSADGAIQLREHAVDKQQFAIDFSKLQPDVEKVAFTITIYDAVARKQTFAHVTDLYLRILEERTGNELIRFPLENFTVENAIVAGELYRYQSEWKFNAVSSGFHGGLAALCGNFGVEVSQEQGTPSPQTEAAATKQGAAPTPAPQPGSAPKPAATPAPQPSAAPKPAATPVPPPAPPIQLTKVELKKKGESISLKKKSGSLGQLLVNLNWNKKSAASSGLFGLGKAARIDLDLGCLYEMASGEKGCIQALGNTYGNYQYFPYISLDGDDRTGSVTTGENMRVNGNEIREFKRILVYAYIYSGVAKWAETDGIVTITQADNPDIVVRMDVHDPRKIMCAVAMIERDGDTFTIKRLVEYFNGHQDMDRHYGWNMRWTAGRK